MSRTSAVVALVGTMLSGVSPGIAAEAVAPSPPVIETIEIPHLDRWFISPDGSLVAGYLGDHRAPETWCLHELPSGTQRWCIDAAPGGEPLASRAAWMPDGSAFLVTEDLPDDPDIWRIDAATGDATNLTDDGLAGRVPDLEASLGAGDPPLLIDAFPAVSPDDLSIAFLRLVGAEGRSPTLQRMASEGGTPTEVVQLDQIPIDPPVWSHDGRWLHWVEWGERRGDAIGSATPDGVESRRIALSAPGDPEWLPDQIRGVLADGRLLMEGTCDGFGECSGWLVDPVSGIAEPLLTESADVPPPALVSSAASPDGRSIAALVLRGDAVLLELIDADTRVVQRIPLPDPRPTNTTAVHWLTDGRILIGGESDHPRRYRAITLPSAWRSAG